MDPGMAYPPSESARFSVRRTPRSFKPAGGRALHSTPAPQAMPGYSLNDYHQRSKHRPERYAPGPGRLDWASQPDPFRCFEGAKRVALPRAAHGLETRYRALRRGELPAPRAIDIDSVAVLFELALGISAWKSQGGTSWALRANPSSGNLHPSEGYLLSAAVPGLAAGTYHYLSRDHALELRGEWRTPPHLDGVLVGLTRIAWREAWKYGMRAFRYCQHDCGHAIATLSYAAAALGWRARLLAAPRDEEIAARLGLEVGSSDPEREMPECLLWIAAGEAPPAPLPPVPSRWHGKANRLSPTHVAWDDIARADALVRKPRLPHEPDAAPLEARERAGDPALDLTAAQLFRQRRSAVAFDGVTRIGAQAFYTMLDATLPRTGVPPWSTWPWPAEVHLAIFVHRVDGLEPGLYLLVRSPAALEALKASLRPEWLWQKVGPAQLPLHLLMPGDLRAAAKFVSCHQEIAADSCYALGMLAHFALAVREPWRYRPLFWECGLLGQVLYLEAEAAGIRGTGIGCFFDDEMHALLGLQDQSWQSFYHFTAGGALEDPRLATLPA